MCSCVYISQRFNPLPLYLLLRWFDWDINSNNESGRLNLRSSDKALTKLEDVGQQLSLTFSLDGSLLATGGEVYMTL